MRRSYKGCPALDDARFYFHREPSNKTAAAFLEAAYDAWNDSNIDECEFANQVKVAQSWLAGKWTDSFEQQGASK